MTIEQLDEKLKAEYGQLLLQQEILQAKINEIKQRIIGELNKPPDSPKEKDMD